eukprot:scaffold229571_cov46-Attheya_sp.AAC.2
MVSFISEDVYDGSAKGSLLGVVDFLGQTVQSTFTCCKALGVATVKQIMPTGSIGRLTVGSNISA